MVKQRNCMSGLPGGRLGMSGTSVIVMLLGIAIDAAQEESTEH